MANHHLDVCVVRNASDLLRLKPEWDALYERALNPRLSQSFEWAWCTWNNMAQPQGCRLYCITVRDRGRLALIWPLIISRHKRLWSVVTSLGTPEDYAVDMLAERVPDLPVLLRSAWNAVLRDCPVDFVRLALVRDDALLLNRDDALLLKVMVGERWQVITHQTSPYLTWEGFPDWQSYWASRRPKFRQRVDRLQRRLGELGDIAMEVTSSPEECQKAVKWMLRHKRQWLARKRIGFSPSIGSDQYAVFLMSACDEVATYGRLAGFSLTLDGITIATQISVISRGLVENLHIAYDVQYSKFAPGLILDKYALGWAHSRNLSYDFHFGTDQRKRHLASGECDLKTSHVYLSGWGWVHEQLRRAWNSPLVPQLRPPGRRALRAPAG